MILSYPLSDKGIQFEENTVNILVVESPKYYRELIEQIVNLENGSDSTLFLSENYEFIDFNKTAEVIYFFEDIDFNNRKILSKIFSDLKSIANEDLYVETAEMISYVEKYIQNLLGNIDLQLSYQDVDMDTLLKAVKLSVAKDYDSQIEKICDYIDIVNQVFSKKLFIFFNLKTVMEDFELVELYQFCNYKKVHLLLCENTHREKLDYEKITLIDKDLCQIF